MQEQKVENKTVLFVCTANRHRSPTAELIGKIIGSAGRYSSCGSNRAACQKNNGYYMTRGLLEESDEIVCMEKSNKNDINQAYGDRFNNKIRVINIPDEYKGYEMALISHLIEAYPF